MRPNFDSIGGEETGATSTPGGVLISSWAWTSICSWAWTSIDSWAWTSIDSWTESTWAPGEFSAGCAIGERDAIDFDRLLGVKTATNWNQERLYPTIVIGALGDLPNGTILGSLLHSFESKRFRCGEECVNPLVFSLMNAPFGILQPSTIFFFPSSPSLINYVLNAIDFDTGGIFDRLCDRRARLDRLRRPWKFPAVAAVEVLH